MTIIVYRLQKEILVFGRHVPKLWQRKGGLWDLLNDLQVAAIITLYSMLQLLIIMNILSSSFLLLYKRWEFVCRYYNNMFFCIYLSNWFWKGNNSCYFLVFYERQYLGLTIMYWYSWYIDLVFKMDDLEWYVVYIFMLQKSYQHHSHCGIYSEPCMWIRQMNGLVEYSIDGNT